MAITKEREMYTRILVPLDGSESGERALQEAVALAQEGKSTLELLHVVGDYPLLADMVSAADMPALHHAMKRRGQDLLAAATYAASVRGVKAQARIVEIDGQRVAQVIVAQACEHDCGLIVMGTHGRRGFNRLVVGSDAEQVIRTSPVPVLLVPPHKA
jgi:nucleotide-binding universal stress UspA family protein